MPLSAPSRALRALTLAAAVLWAGAVSAATITVDTLDDELNADGDCSLREAVEAADTNAAVDGCAAGAGADTVVFAAGLAGTVTLGSAITIRTNVVIDGAVGGGAIVVSGGGQTRVFVIDQRVVTLRSLTIRDGAAPVGGGVLIVDGGSLTTELVTFADNEATGNAAAQGGGAVFVGEGTAEFRDSAFTGNAASGGQGSGGAVALAAGTTVSMLRCTLSGNTAGRAGGGVEVLEATLALIRTDFSGNDAGTRPGNGGAVHVTGAGTVTADRGTVADNTASEGGGFWNALEGTMTLDGTTFTGNAAEEGGALYSNGVLTLIGVTASGNTATGDDGAGGAVWSDGRLAIVGGTFEQNTTTGPGGAIATDGEGSVVLVEAIVRGNAAATGGGLHANRGRAVVIGGLIGDNTAVDGGGVWAGGMLIVSGGRGDIPEDLSPGVPLPEATPPRITGNTATGGAAGQGGGGLYLRRNADATLSDALVTTNAASGAAGSGGGVLTEGRLTVRRGQIASNTANRAGGGIEVSGGRTDLLDAQVALNDAGTAPGNGGGVHVAGATLIVRGGTINGNAAVDGGGIWTAGSLSMNAGASGDRDTDAAAIDGDRSAFTTLTGNRATGATASSGGGGIYVETGGSADLRYALLSNNTATGALGSGGGLLIADGGSAALAFSEITGNTANRAGGGIELFDDASTAEATTLTLRAVDVSSNAISVAAPGNGGGVHIGGAGSAMATESLVAGNRAVEGGGLWVAAGASLTMGNATVSNNTATADGGGVYDDGGATIALESVTVAANAAGLAGGGLLAAGAGVSIRNTLVGTNTATTGADCAGPVASGGFNLVASTVGCTLSGDTATNVTGVDPNIRGLLANGGFTRTHAPRPASPAVDVGDSAFAVDQRGLPRQDPDDIGALDVAATPVALGEDPVAGAFGLATPAPNPASTRTTVEFSVAAPGRVELALFDALGRRVRTVFDGEALPGGVESVAVDVSGLATGVYIARLSGAAGVATRTLTVVR